MLLDIDEGIGSSVVLGEGKIDELNVAIIHEIYIFNTNFNNKYCFNGKGIQT